MTYIAAHCPTFVCSTPHFRMVQPTDPHGPTPRNPLRPGAGRARSAALRGLDPISFVEFHFLLPSLTILRVVVLMSAHTLLTGCFGDPRVRVEICGDVAIPYTIDALRLSLRDEGQVEVSGGVFELFSPGEIDLDGGNADAGTGDGGGCLPGEREAFPVDFELRGGAGRMWVSVQGLKDGIEVMKVVARVEFPTQGVADVTVALSADCVGVQCAFGQTCVQEQCEIAQFEGTPDVCDELGDPVAPDGGAPLCSERR